ncbi:MAG TPA: patatin-like phospholipase family protein [Kofleriaceae bacterium]|nr:patatin-like phospholipase family protein [Kofleriaceae bacterium]
MGRWWLVVCCALAGCPHGGSTAPAPSPPDICPTEVCPELEQQTPPRRGGVQPYAITISGGVSLGAYEAGLNWTVLELLRNARDHEARLEGVTGASAGSINSLLTAIRWCGAAPLQKGKNDVDHNLFSDAWRDIGFDELMPDDPADYARRDEPRTYGADLVMSRKKAFAKILGRVERLLTAGGGFKTCDLRLGMTVTSRDPKSLVVSDLHVANQRYVIPLRVRSDGTSIEFYVDTRIQDSARKDLLGNLLFLAPDHVISDPDPRKARFVVDPPKVLRAALASSAFPGAFGPVELSHCVALSPRKSPTETDEQRNKRVCSGGKVVHSSKCKALGDALLLDGTAVQCTQKFIDGGVFDNIPLGVAMAQLESDLEARPTPERARRPLRYLYVYYNNRRGVPPRGPPKQAARADGDGPLGDTLAAVNGVIGTAQEYELHNVLRYNRWNAGTSKQAYAIADLLDRNGAQPANRTTADVTGAGAKAAALKGRLRSSLPTSDGEKKEVADQLRDLAWALEQFSLSGAEFLAVQDDVLESLKILCETPRPGCPRDAVADLRADVRNNRELVLTRRFSPLTGMHVGHFGAFFDRSFRDYDYYAGVYDGLVSEAFRRCDAATRSPVNQAEQAAVQQSVMPQAPRAEPEDPRKCPYRQFVAARDELGITSGPAFEVSEALWAMEHGATPGRYPRGRIGQVMEALFDPRRCKPADGETLTEKNRYCVHDLGLEAFLARLDDTDYRPQSKFLAWAQKNPSRWWMLPAAHGAERATELAREEQRGTVGFAAALAASYVEIAVDQGNDDFWVAPSSLPRRFGLVPRSLFPFFALSMHPTRRAELGLVRGGVRPPWPGCLDFLFDVSTRVTVRPPEDADDDHGYGLFTRGAVVPHLSGAMVGRIPSPIVSSIGLRSGVPVVPFNIGPPSFTLREQINAELDFVFLADKLRFSVGCNPLAPEPFHHCWRDLYYTFGVNDLAGLAYWTGLNPFEVDRLALPFVAPRLPFRPGLWDDGVAVETGLLRAGYQPFWWLGAWADTSIVASDDTSWNGSLSLELRPPGGWGRVIQSLGARGGFPLTIRENARVRDGNLEAVLVLAAPIHLRLAIGAFPGRDEGEYRPLEHPYFSIGFDPGSIPVWLFEQLAGRGR